MERNKVALERERLERERQQQQQQQERERQAKNAEQEVTKHFEESLRRAKDKVCASHSLSMCVSVFCITFSYFTYVSVRWKLLLDFDDYNSI